MLRSLHARTSQCQLRLFSAEDVKLVNQFVQQATVPFHQSLLPSSMTSSDAYVTTKLHKFHCACRFEVYLAHHHNFWHAVVSQPHVHKDCSSQDTPHGTLFQHARLTMQRTCYPTRQPNTSGRHTILLKMLGLVRERLCGGLAAEHTRHRQCVAHSTASLVAPPNLSSLRNLLVARCSNPRCAFRAARLTSLM